MTTLSSLVRKIAVLAVVASPAVAFAQTNLINPDAGQVKGIVNNSLQILNIVLVGVFILALVVFGYGVVKYISAAGSPDKEKEARQFLWWGVVGVFVLASVFGLVQFVGKYFGVGQGAGTIQIPQVQNPNQ